jgi:hypothetical protein
VSTLEPDGCEPYRELLGVYALDALDPEEADRVREHLAGCPRCQQEVDQHREAVVFLATASVGGPAPDRMWERIAESIGTGQPPSGAAAPAPVLPASRPQQARWRRPAQAVALVAAAVIITLVGVQTARVSNLNHKVNQLAAAARQSAGVEGLAAALVDPTAHHLTLTSTTEGAEPLGQLIILPSGAAYLVGSRLPALATGHAYQIWSMITGRAVSVGVFGARPTAVAFTVDPNSPATAYLITIEPAGGVVTPTTAPVARAEA